MRWEKNEWYTMSQVTNQMSYTIYSSRCLIREFQTELREDPESMLYVLLVLMYTLSVIFLSFHLFDVSTTCAAPQSMLWFVFIQWVALAFRTSRFCACCMPDEARDGRNVALK